MLSILIPTYNYDITQLTKELHRQAMDQMIDFEIIVMEDGSTKEVETNHSISELVNCRHIVLKENIGRSAIRNKLADEAKYEHLLFMDCDAEVCSEQFIERYLSFCHEECVVIGGTAYDPDESNPNFSLRLKYGRKREARTAVDRETLEHKNKIDNQFSSFRGERQGVRSNFATFNFLIAKTIFNRVRFDESIRGYGHEDMLFGHQLHQLGFEFIQIENPLIHKGLDSNETFIKKTEEATRNLFLLYKTGKYPFLAQESKLLSTFLKFKKWNFVGLFALKFDFTKYLLSKQLCSKNPSLFLYDWYKILFLCKTSYIK
ncbi:MAG: glycosyltransferase family 2 protein [Paludibacter sp.]|nr:glycosyltransferase family 2 protein [Paludibacter sp.]